jgi:hypothetical protein
MKKKKVFYFLREGRDLSHTFLSMRKISTLGYLIINIYMKKDGDVWKGKLIALLHDPPHKPRAIAEHEDQRSSFLNRLGLTDDDFKSFNKTAIFKLQLR